MKKSKTIDHHKEFDISMFLRGIATSPYYGLALLFLNKPTPKQDQLKIENIKMIFYGLFSAILYVVLFKYQAEIIRFAELTREGEKLYFLVPIGVAFLFSYAHGGFATNFWQSLGLRNKNDLGKEPSWTPYNS